MRYTILIFPVIAMVTMFLDKELTCPTLDICLAIMVATLFIMLAILIK